MRVLIIHEWARSLTSEERVVCRTRMTRKGHLRHVAKAFAPACWVGSIWSPASVLLPALLRHVSASSPLGTGSGRVLSPTSSWELLVPLRVLPGAGSEEDNRGSIIRRQRVEGRRD